MCCDSWDHKDSDMTELKDYIAKMYTNLVILCGSGSGKNFLLLVLILLI